MIVERKSNDVDDILRHPYDYLRAGEEVSLCSICHPKMENEHIEVSVGREHMDTEYPVETFYIKTIQGREHTNRYCKSQELPDVYEQVIKSLHEEID